VTQDALPAEDVREALARAALDNAQRLLTDASTLLEAGSAPTAHSLAVLALEEVGKAVICVGGFAGDDNQITTRSKFKEEIRDHKAKLQWVRNSLDLVRSVLTFQPEMAESSKVYMEALQKQVANDHAKKLRGLYVGLANSDEVETPASVTPEEAREACAVATWAEYVVRTLFIDRRGVIVEWDKDGKAKRIIKPSGSA
jgi:AbiV family abortive infection protein